MPEREVLCEDCEKEKEKIEERGDAKVVSCDPIPGKPGWCRLVWRYIEGAATEERRNWVARRSACNVDGLFEALCDVVKSDVEEMQQLPPGKRRDYEFSVQEEERAGILTVAATPSITGFKQPVLTVAFQRDRVDDTIKIHTVYAAPPKNTTLAVTFKWDPKQLSCRLFIGDDAHGLEVWEVSQLTLAPMLPDIPQ